MKNLDQLIVKFKEIKDELKKNLPLHDTVEGFMGGLKTLPKGSVERSKFITQHMSHGPFLSSLNAHPQGKQMHAMIMGHLNSKANAGPKSFGGPMFVAKSVEIDPLEELEKHYIAPYVEFGKAAALSIVADDRQRAMAMGAPVAKTSSMTGKMKGGGNTQLTHPGDSSRANMFNDAISGAYEPPKKGAAKKLTGLDRIKALNAQPITKDEDDKTAVSPAKLDAEGNAVASAHPQSWQPGQHVHAALSMLPKGDSKQVHKPVALPAGHGKGQISPITTSLPKLKPAGEKYATVGGNAPTPNDVKPPTVSLRPHLNKKEASPKFEKTVNDSYAPTPNGMAMSSDEKLTLNKGGQWNLDKNDKKTGEPEKTVAKAECSKCHADPCECQTTGVLVDKMDGDVGSC